MGAGERAELVTRVEAALTEAWRRQCGWIPGGQSAYVDGLLVCRSLLPDPMLSTTVVRRDPLDCAAAVESAARLFAIVGVPLAVEVAEGARPQLEQALANRGMGEVVRRPAMVAAVDSIRATVPPDGLKLGPVGSATGLATVREVQVRAFGLLPEVAEGLLHENILHTAGVHQFGAWLDGQLVGCLTMQIDDQTAGLFGVATDPDHQGRGVATALTATALVKARKLGADLAWLQSTEAGMGVYERLGFETIVDFVVWR